MTQHPNGGDNLREHGGNRCARNSHIETRHSAEAQRHFVKDKEGVDNRVDDGAEQHRNERFTRKAVRTQGVVKRVGEILEEDRAVNDLHVRRGVFHNGRCAAREQKDGFYQQRTQRIERE